MPTVSSPAKIERIRGYGAHLVVTGDRYDDALAASREWAATSGALPVHAYDQIETLLGQGTVGLEFEEQAPELDTLLVAVGGGGLIGGIAGWYAGRVRIVAVEPEAAPTLARAMDAGRPVDSPAGGIAADSLAPKRVGELMFPVRAVVSSSAWRWFPTRRSWTPSSRSGTLSGSWRSLAARPLWPRSSPAHMCRIPPSGSASWCAAGIRRAADGTPRGPSSYLCAEGICSARTAVSN